VQKNDKGRVSRLHSTSFRNPTSEVAKQLAAAAACQSSLRQLGEAGSQAAASCHFFDEISEPPVEVDAFGGGWLSLGEAGQALLQPLLIGFNFFGFHRAANV
jgi:hypothetical protein